EMLVGVTRFFRDPDAWQALTTQVIEPLIAHKTAADTLRVWCAGVGTGEEAYTTAILIREALENHSGTGPNFQIFATDIDPNAITAARTGWYGQAMIGLSDARRRRWFTETQVGFQPVKAYRDHCVFSAHDIDRDPPFSNLDLLVCRNMLIYM